MKPHALAQAATALSQGELVVFPTETVYGIGCSAAHPAAIARLIRAKNRPEAQPLTIHLGPAVDPERWAPFDAQATALAHAHWPGPLTLILRKHRHVPSSITGGQPTVGLRVPAHPMAIALLNSCHHGVPATSANRHGRPSPTHIEHAREELAGLAAIFLDGGPCQGGLESTVVSLAEPEPTVFRLGALDLNTLTHTLGRPVRLLANNPAHPVTTKRFFALGMTITKAHAGALPNLTHADSVVLAIHPKPPQAAGVWIQLPNAPNPWVNALYCQFRRLEKQGVKHVIVEHPPQTPRWDAARARLARVVGD